MKTVIKMKSFVSLIMSVLLVAGTFLGCLTYGFTPTIEFDLNESEGEFNYGACGYLYGMAQEEVPSKEVVKSLRISSSSQKVIGGLQHPIGDIDNVSPNLENSDYNVVYLQDVYPTWYYCHEEINRMREAGNYDSEAFVRENFLPQVREKVEMLSGKDYSDSIVYCLYNECDNTVWFGSEHPDGWLMFDDAAKQRFYSAWKEAYELVRSIDPDALIGGPGYCDYDIYEITDFLTYCKENGCLPDVMIYHELGPTSSMWWEDHVKEYREAEKELGIDPLVIIVTEYGTMEECGAPAAMLHYMRAIENSGTYGNVAYWRLADNLCDTCAYANIPNPQWWLYKWYSDFSGARIKGKLLDILHSDAANVIKYRRDAFHLSKLDALGGYDAEEKRADIICCGAEYDFQIALKNVRRNIGKKVKVSVEAVTFEGISGEVLSPAVISEYETGVTGTLKIGLNGTDKDAVYHITVKEADGVTRETDALPLRYEFENGTLLGNAYTYDSAYATTGNIQGMCGGFENEGDGISLDFDVPEDGDYEISLVFGKANDGPSPSDRHGGKAFMTVDGEESTVSFHNTIKSEYTDKYTFTKHLGKGKHSIKLMHCDGTFVLDSLLLRKSEEREIYCEYDRKNAEHLVIAPADGYYRFDLDGSVRYLKYGLNYIDFSSDAKNSVTAEYSEDLITVTPEEMALTGSAEKAEGIRGRYITGISSDSGEAAFTVTAPESGRYAVTLTYANNEEGGAHAYNVDIIEEYVTVNVNGTVSEIWCTSTYSSDTYRTAVGYIDLNEGENAVVLSNDGHNRFNNLTSHSPDISKVCINKAVK